MAKTGVEREFAGHSSGFRHYVKEAWQRFVHQEMPRRRAGEVERRGEFLLIYPQISMEVEVMGPAQIEKFEKRLEKGEELVRRRLGISQPGGDGLRSDKRGEHSQQEDYSQPNEQKAGDFEAVGGKAQAAGFGF